jgi:DHA2 family methylenomycin A resistance protein-like MFS transporter
MNVQAAWFIPGSGPVSWTGLAGALGIAVFGTLVSDGPVAGMRLSVVISAALLAVTGLLSFRLAGPSARSA